MSTRTSARSLYNLDGRFCRFESRLQASLERLHSARSFNVAATLDNHLVLYSLVKGRGMVQESLKSNMASSSVQRAVISYTGTIVRYERFQRMRS